MGVGFRQAAAGLLQLLEAPHDVPADVRKGGGLRKQQVQSTAYTELVRRQGVGAGQPACDHHFNCQGGLA